MIDTANPLDVKSPAVDRPEAPSAKPSAADIHQLTATIALLLIDKIGPRGLQALLSSAGSLTSLLAGQIDPQVVRALPAVARQHLVGFLRNPEGSAYWEQAEHNLEWLAAAGGTLLSKWHPCFPQRLLELVDCPPILFALGNVEHLTKPMVSIVGARKPSPSGLRTATRFARELADAGLCVGSGMALGIDTAAHYGALESSAATVAIWATGLDTPYPRSNHALAEKLIAHGTVISEMPLGTPPLRGYFPRRNRIVAGISEAVVVIEAAQRSGSLITAQLAAEHNREVCAVPGPIERVTSQGCHQLIKQGAALVESTEDIINHLVGVRTLSIHSPSQGQTDIQRLKSERLAGLSQTLKEVYDLVESEAKPFELIANQCALSTEQLNMALIDLELAGLVIASSGLYLRSE
jgi:DNA processing protein